MTHAHTLSLGTLGLTRDDLVLIAPNAPDAMAAYAAECARLGIKYLYDPSMQAPRLSPEDLRAGFAGASMLIGNDYEFGMMAEKLGVDEPGLRRLVPTSIVTRGKDGASIHRRGEPTIDVPVAQIAQAVDPTGVGDAFRAGFLAGLSWQLELERCAQLGSVLAAHVIETVGTQEYVLKAPAFLDRFRAAYGDAAAGEVAARLRDRRS